MVLIQYLLFLIFHLNQKINLFYLMKHYKKNIMVVQVNLMLLIIQMFLHPYLIMHNYSFFNFLLYNYNHLIYSFHMLILHHVLDILLLHLVILIFFILMMYIIMMLNHIMLHHFLLLNLVFLLHLKIMYHLYIYYVINHLNQLIKNMQILVYDQVYVMLIF